MPRTLARDEAYGRLRAWIIDGTLRPGEVLRDQNIAGALGVSRTPVREALRRLEDEGFVETALNRWTRVALIDWKQAEEAYVIIVALEVLALELASTKLSSEDLRQMRTANRDMRLAAEGGSPAAAVAADESFHEVWILRAANQELLGLLRQQKTKLRRVELAYFDGTARARHSFREHTAVVVALEEGLCSKAAAALQRHWHGSVERMRAFVVAAASNDQKRE
jgi:DNA-binding GntR family transcriptional regulator